MKHTPGPWLIRQGDKWTSDVVTDDLPLPDGTPAFWNVASANRRRDEVKANLHLIAAAPDLLEALVQIVDGADKNQAAIATPILIAAKAAIAKATGATP